MPMDEGYERRSFERVHLPSPLRGTIGSVRVFVIDASLGGVQVLHQGHLPEVGAPCTVLFEWEGAPVTLDCVRVRTAVHRRPQSEVDKYVFSSGLQIETCDEASRVTLKEMITYYVERALDEQKANAFARPAFSALSYQTSSGDEYLKCELVGTEWSKTKSKGSDQPKNGFTVSVDENEAQVDILCKSYAEGDDENRALIRTFATLSVSNREGTPTRRYKP